MTFGAHLHSSMVCVSTLDWHKEKATRNTVFPFFCCSFDGSIHQRGRRLVVKRQRRFRRPRRLVIFACRVCVCVCAKRCKLDSGDGDQKKFVLPRRPIATLFFPHTRLRCFFCAVDWFARGVRLSRDTHTHTHTEARRASQPLSAFFERAKRSHASRREFGVNQGGFRNLGTLKTRLFESAVAKASDLQ